MAVERLFEADNWSQKPALFPLFGDKFVCDSDPGLALDALALPARVPRLVEGLVSVVEYTRRRFLPLNANARHEL